MLYYPQLSTGAVGQFPIRRRLDMRTVSNESCSGDSIRMADASAKLTHWRLEYKNLTDGEWASIEQLFEASEGRLNTFTFLDPTDNLLMWSEDWTKAVWTAGPMIQMAAGIADPMGGTGGVRVTNSGQAAQRIMQTVAGASWLQYCFSAYVRSDTGVTVQMVVSTNGEESMSAVAAGPAWTRVVKAGSLSAKQDGISFGFELTAGTTIDVFGPQVEAQVAAGQYKKTSDRAGVYSKTRFDSDLLTVTADGLNDNSCVVELVSGE